jgi:hypothetical protein
MTRDSLPVLLATAALIAAVGSYVSAIDTVAMNLQELAQRANRIFTGRVIDVRSGTVEAGGGVLPTTIYRLQVGDTFKGSYPAPGKRGTIIEVQMVGSSSSKARSARGGPVHQLMLLDVPRLDVGEEYVLFTTTPSRVGLSTTVGLGQGCFKVSRRQREEPLALNAVANDGLFRGMSTGPRPRIHGPVSYRELSRQIRSVLGQ